jgi:hypothetical protein
MPRGDRTGPLGFGAMTGRAAGYCAGFGIPGYANPALSQGFGGGRGFWGRGFGSGRGWGHWFFATHVPGWARFGGYATPYFTLDPKTEKQALKNQADALQAELDHVKKRLSEIESETTEL